MTDSVVEVFAVVAAIKCSLVMSRLCMQIDVEIAYYKFQAIDSYINLLLKAAAARNEKSGSRVQIPVESITLTYAQMLLEEILIHIFACSYLRVK